MKYWKRIAAWVTLLLCVPVFLSGASVAIEYSSQFYNSLHSSESGFYESWSFRDAIIRILQEITPAESIVEMEYGIYPGLSLSNGDTVHISTYLLGDTNLRYYMMDAATQTVITNMEMRGIDVAKTADTWNRSYRYVLAFSGGSMRVWENGNLEQDVSEVMVPLLDQLHAAEREPSDVSILLCVGESTRGTFDFGSGVIGANYGGWKNSLNASGFYWGIAVTAIGIALAVLAIRWREERRVAVNVIVRVLSHIWLEVKLVAAWLCAVFTYLCCTDLLWGYYGVVFPVVCLVALLLLILWYLLLEFIRNFRTWTQNSLIRRGVCGIRGLYRKILNGTPLERKYLIRFFAFLGVETSLIIFDVMLLASYRSTIRGLMIFLLFAAIIAVTVLYLYRLRDFLEDLAALRVTVEDMSRGNLTPKANIPENHDLYPITDAIQHLGEGLNNAVEARIKSERMKAELVTNVSHDLKTPLTSIISYSRLLDELNLDEPAGGYVKILCAKSDRLQHLTRDLFEVSKAQSGNLPVTLTRIDFKAHLEQTLAELSERMDASGLTFRTSVPAHPVWIDADGDRLYRVMENLIVNAVNYSMPGTRVWISLSDENTAEFSIRNISAEEITFTAEQLMERFVRGDAARTQDDSDAAKSGSGLGLAIAKSFTEAIGGQFDLNICDDIFRVTLTFTLQAPPEA